MTNEELQENIAYIKRNAIGNVKALNIDVPVLLALIAKVESLAADADDLLSKNNFHDDPVEDIAHALAHELEEAELNPNDLVTVNREKLRLIAKRVLEKASAMAKEKA